MANYMEFKKVEFENLLNNTIGKIGHEKNDLGKQWRDITSQLRNKGNNVQEHVYMLPTKNPSVSIVIYSSVSCYNGKTRNEGKDAVRVDVLCKSSEKGLQIKKIKKHYRTSGIFNNLMETILKINEKSTLFQNWYDIKKLGF